MSQTLIHDPVYQRPSPLGTSAVSSAHGHSLLHFWHLPMVTQGSNVMMHIAFDWMFWFADNSKACFPESSALREWAGGQIAPVDWLLSRWDTAASESLLVLLQISFSDIYLGETIYQWRWQSHLALKTEEKSRGCKSLSEECTSKFYYKEKNEFAFWLVFRDF